MADMLETMYAAPGIGLAAPQVGVLKRVIVLDVAREGDTPEPYKMANPELIWVSDDDIVYNEGCLSLPDHYADVARPAAIKVRYLDERERDPRSWRPMACSPPASSTRWTISTASCSSTTSPRSSAT